MGEFSQSVAIVYPAEFSNWYANRDHGITDLHTTIMYLGQFEDIDYLKEDVLEALAPVDFNMYLWVEIFDTERFGPNQDIPVLRVRHDVLQSKFDEVESVLLAAGIKNGSSFPDYKPHITVTEEVFAIPPKNALLSPAELWWGDGRDRLV